MRVRKQVMVSIKPEILAEMEKVKEDMGIPLSRQLELAWLKVNK